MSEYTTISLRKEFVADVEAYIEDQPFGSVNEFVTHVALQQIASDDRVSEAQTRQIAHQHRSPGDMDRARPTPH